MRLEARKDAHGGQQANRRKAHQGSAEKEARAGETMRQIPAACTCCPAFAIERAICSMKLAPAMLDWRSESYLQSSHLCPRAQCCGCRCTDGSTRHACTCTSLHLPCISLSSPLHLPSSAIPLLRCTKRRGLLIRIPRDTLKRWRLPKRSATCKGGWDPQRSAEELHHGSEGSTQKRKPSSAPSIDHESGG